MRPEEILKNAEAYASEAHKGNAEFIEAAEDAYLMGATFANEINAIELLALRAENAKLRDLAKMLLQLDNESNGGDYGGGMCDCKDNNDCAYQSVALAGLLSQFETALNSTTTDPLYQAAPEMLEALERIVEKEIEADKDNRFAADLHNNSIGVGVDFDYISFPPMPEWVKYAQHIIQKAKGEHSPADQDEF